MEQMDLYDTPGGRLDAWIAQNLLPDEEFSRQIREATHRTAEFLKGICFRETTVSKVVKGGSSGKGTALRNGSDADLVVFLACFTCFEDQTKERGDIINEIHEMLNKCRQSIAYDIEIEEPKEKKDPKGRLYQPRSLSFTIQSRKVKESISVDVLPAFNALGSISADMKPDPEVYVSLINAKGLPGDFSPCFTELQRNFVKRRPGKLKNLIRLVKHWFKECVKSKYKSQSLPPKYALELLTIFAWEQGSGADDFCTDEGFCTVLNLLCQYQKICIYWTENYDFENRIVGDYVRRQLRKPRPVILDPADPTGMVGQEASWNLVAEEAAMCLQSACCFDCEAWNVKPAIPVPRATSPPPKKQIFVRNPDGRTIAYLVWPKLSVEHLKMMIEKRTKIPVDQQLLTYCDRELEDDNTLGYYKIRNKATLFLLMRLREG
ncbi:2'-5'-oligoadenylate synthase 1-like [Ambystoma mexicanum]|uniref:2'-5'-oligoadenylate synthase 1-like n=1 Tax=Ambystoma mexicanum TaxID=8296 RepID=UPI0037E94D54